MVWVWGGSTWREREQERVGEQETASQSTCWIICALKRLITVSGYAHTLTHMLQHAHTYTHTHFPLTLHCSLPCQKYLVTTLSKDTHTNTHTDTQKLKEQREEGV